MCKPMRFAQVAVIAGLALGANFAFAEQLYENEGSNDPISNAQKLTGEGVTVPADGINLGDQDTPAILGSIEIGVTEEDVDFYSFFYSPGETIEIDLNNGGFGGKKSFNSYMTLFGPGPAYEVLEENDDDDRPGVPVSGDSFISFTLDDPNAEGVYTIGITNFGRTFNDGGTINNPENLANGDYTLVITNLDAGGGAGDVVDVQIKVKPGKAKAVRDCLNPKARGQIKVAILSHEGFDAMAIDVDTLAFGQDGNEPSLAKCKKKGKDVNKDGSLDLVCKFWNHLAEFEAGDVMGKLTGELVDGTKFRGDAPLKVKPFNSKGQCRQPAG